MKRATGGDPRESISFGRYAADAGTTWRPVMRTFAPAYEATEDVMEAMRRIERLDHDLARHPHLVEGLAARLRREALARNAFGTASIEGNPLTLAEVETLLDHPSPGGARAVDEVEILNYAQLMTSPRAQRAPRTPQDVLRVHAALFRGVLRDAGEWKATVNFIGDPATRRVVYVPAAPERVVPELRNALDWLHGARSVPPLVRALLFHHEFESIHPFRDGNGRAGRALTPMALHAFGYAGSALAPIDYVLHRRRAAYYAALAAVERNGFRDHSPWLRFMVGVVREAYEEAVASALFQDGLPPGLPARQRQLAEWFAQLRQRDAGRRVKFSDVHQAFPAVADRTLKRDLAALRDAGVLEAEGVLKGTTYRLRQAPSSGEARTRTSRPSRGRGTRTRCGRRAPR